MNNFPMAGNVRMPQPPYNPKKQPPVLAGDVRIDPSIKKNPKQPVLAGLVTPKPAQKKPTPGVMAGKVPPKPTPQKTGKGKMAAIVAACVAVVVALAAIIKKVIKKP